MTRLKGSMVFGVGMLCLVAATMIRGAADPNDVRTHEPTRIALIDMARVFKTSVFFEKKREALKEKITESETAAKTQLAEINRLTQGLSTLEKGTEERADLEGRLKRKQAEFDEFRKGESRRFLKEESQIYRDTYERVASEVARHSREHGFDLVIRHNPDPMTETDPQKLLQSMNRMVIYENGLDITEEIIAALKDNAN